MDSRIKRVDLFSDAVFAIAITLLVLELPFEKVEEGQLAHALGEHWSSFAAYAVSFAGIGIAWIHHHAVFDQIQRITRELLLTQPRPAADDRVPAVPDAASRRVHRTGRRRPDRRARVRLRVDGVGHDDAGHLGLRAARARCPEVRHFRARRAPA